MRSLSYFFQRSSNGQASHQGFEPHFVKASIAHPLDAVRGGELGHAAAGFCGGKYCSNCAMRRLTTTTAASPKAIPPSM